jgi:PAS domain S-box-containing protein
VDGEPFWLPGRGGEALRRILRGDLLRQMLEGTSAGVGVLDADLRYLYVNPALARMNGVPADDHLGRTIAEVVPDIDAGEAVLRQVLADGQSRETISSGQTKAPSGLPRRYWHGAYHRLTDGDRVVGLVGIVLEISEDRNTRLELERAQDRLALLDSAAVRIGTTLDTRTTCAELADFLVPELADAASVEVLPDDMADGLRPLGRGSLRMCRIAMASLPALRPMMPVFGRPGEYVDYQEGSGMRQCLESGRPLIFNRLTDEDMRTAGPNEEREAAYRAIGMHSALVVPLAARGHPIGTVTMARVGSSPPFTRQDVVIAQDLVGRAAINLDNARRYTREHGIARELQRALLAEVTLPHRNLEVAARYLPAGSSALVGGDWFDVIRLPRGRTLLAIGDVMGHGIEAAADMTRYRALMRVTAATDVPPQRLLERVDELADQAGTLRPATCVLALADPVAGTCTYASAGHLPVAVVDQEGRVGLVDVDKGPPLGTGLRKGTEGGRYRAVTRPIDPERVLLLYTDGLVERRDEDIDVSLARLAGLSLPVQAPLEELLDELIAKVGHPGAEDDVAVLAARAAPPGAVRR